jgi:hypothetical protein
MSLFCPRKAWRTPPARQSHYRPCLEALEDRTVPTSLRYSTFLHGTVFGTAVDGAGNVYVTGQSDSGLPTTPGAFETTGTGAFVAKLNPTGTAVLYATYLGNGNFGRGEGTGIAVDAVGDAYVIGSQANIPTTANAIATSGGSNYPAQADFVAELNPTGSGLIYATYLPGTVNYPVTIGCSGAIALDGSGNIYVAGGAQAGFPVTASAFQTAYLGGSVDAAANAFFMKINPALSGTASVVYATYLGGNGTVGDAATAIALDGAGNAYLEGYTHSTNFPTTGGAFQTTLGGGQEDAFVAKINPSLSGAASLVYSTYLGGSGFSGYVASVYGITEQIDGGIAVDGAGNAYVTSATTSLSFPTTPGAYQVNSNMPNLNNGGASGSTQPSDVFVTKLNATGSALVYSTYIGGGSFVSGTYHGKPVISGTRSGGASIAVDARGDAELTGWTNSTTFPTVNALQTANAGGYDAFVTVLNPAGSSLLFSSCFGGSGNDYGFGIALDSAGNAYVAGGAGSSNFPTTPGAYQTTQGGGFAAKISAVVPTFVVSGFYSAITAGQSGTITVTAMNNGTLNTAYTGTVHLTSSDPQAVLPADAQLVNGTGTFSVSLKTAGAQSITVADAGSGMIGFQSGIIVNAGPATHFGLSAPPTAAAGVAFSVTVMALDAYGNAATLYSGTVAITTTDPQASVPGPYTYYDDCFTFSMILWTHGTQTITASDLGLPSIDGLWTIDVG